MLYVRRDGVRDRYVLKMCFSKILAQNNNNNNILYVESGACAIDAAASSRYNIIYTRVPTVSGGRIGWGLRVGWCGLV